MTKAKEKVIVFDTETTGFVEPEIIEAAWVSVSWPPSVDNVLEQYEQRFKPTKRIELGAMSTHHILDEELKDCPPSSSFALPDGIDYMIGHNVDYDWDMAGKPDVKRICTLALARKYLPKLDSHKQSALIYYLYSDNPAAAREAVKAAHSALPDVLNCLDVLGFLIAVIQLNQLENATDDGPILNSWEDLWCLSEAARIPEIMTFGKHKGDHMRDVPRSYKQWLLRQDDLDPYVKKAIDIYW